MFPSSAPRPDLPHALGPWRLRLLLASALLWGARGVAAGALAGLLVLLAGHLFPVETALWAFACVGMGLLAGMVYGAATAPRHGAIARHVDRAAGLADRLATAWELRSSDAPVARLQRADALERLRPLFPEDVLPFATPRRELAVMGAAMALALVSLVLPNPMGEVVAEQRAFREELAKAADKLAEAKDKAARKEARPLTEEEQARIAELLEEAQKALGEVQSLPEALEALSKTEEALQRLEDPANQAAGKALDALAGALAGSGAAADLAAAVAARDDAEVEQALEELGRELADLSEEERRELVEALQDAANAASAAGAQGMAGQLRAAARVAGQGGPAAALAQLRDALAQAREGEARSAQVRSMVQGVRGARNGLSAAVSARGGGRGQGQGQGRGQGSGQGQGQGSGRGQGSGQGQGSGSGQGPGQGQGSGQGQGQPGGDGGRGGTQGGTGAGGDPMGSGSTLQGQGNEEVFVPGREGSGPSEQEVGGSGFTPGVLRPYREVVGQYAETARDHVDRQALPPALKDLVRDYFSALQGTR